MRKKMLYLMHIDWNWIKQRPQYLEEMLEKKYDITVMSPKNYRIKERESKGNLKTFYPIPFIRRFPHIWKIDSYRKKRVVCKQIKRENPDYIYVTAPEYAECIPKWYQGCVIYDCMDDMLAFNSSSHIVKRISEQEKKMVDVADIILVSSEKLKGKLYERYPNIINKEVGLIRNGYDGCLANVRPISKHKNYAICYFGTISHWFNFDFILKSLNRISDIEFWLIGPIESGTSIPQHERLKYFPPVKHSELENITSDVDAFVMPFEINELILSVDPVKLYEYINFGKNILCVEYPEVERFSPFVYFYEDYVSFEKQIYQMKNSKKIKYTNKERESFLLKNNWKQRADTIFDLISKIEKNGELNE